MPDGNPSPSGGLPLNRSLPPGPPAGLFGMRQAAEIRADFLNFGDRLHREYGDIVHFRLGPVSCVLLLHPDQIQECLVRHARHFKKPERFKIIFGRVHGDGVVTADGGRWLRHRRLVQPFFAPDHADRFSEIVLRHTEAMLARWPASGVVEINRELRRLTLGISLESLFSVTNDEGIEELADAIEAMQEWGFRELNRMVLTPRWLPLIFHPRARRALALVTNRIKQIIREHRPTDSSSGNLLDQLLHPGAGRGLGPKELLREAISFLMVSHETICLALTWTIWLLAKHPGIQRSLAEEVRVLLRQRAPIATDLPAFSGIEQAFQESVRLYPPDYALSREVASEVTIGGYALAPGTQVFISPYLTQRDPRWFPEPERFDPSRFEPGAEKTRPACSWIVFGTGPRGCLGRSFATMQASLTIASLLRQFDWSVPEGEPEPLPLAAMHLRPRDQVKLAVRRVTNTLSSI